MLELFASEDWDIDVTNTAGECTMEVVSWDIRKEVRAVIRKQKGRRSKLWKMSVCGKTVKFSEEDGESGYVKSPSTSPDFNNVGSRSYGSGGDQESGISSPSESPDSKRRTRRSSRDSILYVPDEKKVLPPPSKNCKPSAMEIWRNRQSSQDRSFGGDEGEIHGFFRQSAVNRSNTFQL